ncbi:unnamed protein product [Brassica rapa subsp. trilocularis]|uniref:(rape) hypothetical protein n=1 Tax=Brassica napus TaxID=3708 RepID=A0A816WUB6_BRANA|nr:unnamed protein product [Brassica napus]
MFSIGASASLVSGLCVVGPAFRDYGGGEFSDLFLLSSAFETSAWLDRHQRFLLRRGAQRVGGLVCLFLLSGLCTCWFPLCLAEVASVAYQSLTWMLALSFSLSGMGNCSVSGCAFSLVSFYCRFQIFLWTAAVRPQHPGSIVPVA